ncbi:MAG: hypothetical protein HFE40_03625 [Clostridia bacterium]|nr:hypothetical protein [Clostridia bacterium]
MNAAQNSANDDVKEPVKEQTAPPPQTVEMPNMMANVLARHEEIANRIKNNRRF